MFDQKELEELYDEYLKLDGNSFFESDGESSKLEGESTTNGMDVDFVKNLPNIHNNNLSHILSDSASEPDMTNQLDLLNQNFIPSIDGIQKNPLSNVDITTSGERVIRPGSIFDKKEDEFDNEYKEIDEKLTSPDSVFTKNASHGNGWATENYGLWHSGPSSLTFGQASNNNFPYQDLTSSVTCPSYEPQSLNNFSCASKRTYSHQQLGAKVEMVYGLLSMLDTDNREDMSKTFLAMSSSPESCHAMRQSGCLPLLIQLIHSSKLNAEVRNRAADALQNIVHSQTDEKRRRREIRVLKLLQQVREYCDELKNFGEKKSLSREESEKHPINAIGTLMKFSFDAEHRQAICTLGGLHAIADLIQVDHEAHDSASEDSLCITLRRYAGMSLTNLTFGDGKNKALLCSFTKFMRALVDQLKSPSEELRQVTASVLRNLSWRADEESKQVLRNVGAVTALTVSAMEGKKESTLKSILSALWNLSAHCSLNKVDISSVPGALAFLVKMLRYKSPSNTLAIVENAGGILRNISSHIAVREDYRQILRDNGCFEVLLEQLKSPSLTIVSNACGTLWNLSARCPEDQKRLWEMGATTMLRSLIQSKHKMISMGSSAALKNLLTANPNENFVARLDSTAKSLGLQNLPTLFVRKKKALEQELNITLAETWENIEGMGSPSLSCTTQNKTDEKNGSGPKRSDSRDSVRSTQSDSVYERISHIVLQNQETLFENNNNNNNNITLHDSLSEKNNPRKLEEQKLIRRYKTSMIPLPTLKKADQNRMNEKTKVETCIGVDNDDSAEDARGKMRKGTTHVFEMGNLNESTSEAPGNTERCLINQPFAQTTPNSHFTHSLLKEEECDSFDDHKANGEREYESKNCEGNLEKINSNINVNISECKEGGGIPYEKAKPCNNNFMESVKGITDKRQKRDVIKSQESVTLNVCRDLTQANDAPLRVENTFAGPEQQITHLQQEYPAKILDSPPSLDVEVEGATKSRNFDNSSSPTVNSMKMDNAENHKGLMHSCPRGQENLGCNHEGTEVNWREGKHKAKSSEGVGREVNEESFGPSLNLLYEYEKCYDSKKTNDSLVPNFKVGSPMTDSKILQYEASKICREIKKHEEVDMGCSLTSEVSLISCGSFLDTAECSLLTCSSDILDLDESDNLRSVRGVLKSNDLNYRKATAESVSLPSLGSFKNDQIEALDLDKSVLSVTSFTSEVADAEVKDVNFDTYTKTCKNEDGQEETIEDSTFPDGDETLNADSLQNNGELYDDDSSLRCEENLPLDSEVFGDGTDEEVRKKLTPKEKRKTFTERYRTYTIKGIKLVEPSSSSHEVRGERENVGNGPTPVGFDADLSERYVDDHCNANDEKLTKFNSLSATFGDEHKILPSFQFSKSFDRVKNSLPFGMNDSKSLNDLLSVGPDERKELVDNAKLVAFSLKTAVSDYDAEIVSDSEADDLQNSLTIDTATYTKNNRPTYSPEDLKKYQICGDQPLEDSDKKGAKISKDDEKLESPKGVRGRRKLLYSNQKHLRTVDVGLPKCSSKTATDSKVSKPVLHREGTFTKVEGLAPKAAEAKTSKNTSVLNRNLEFKSSIPKPGMRTIASAPVVGICGTSKATRPMPTPTFKTNEKRSEFNPVQKRHVFPTKKQGGNLPPQNGGPARNVNQNGRSGGSPGLRSKSSPVQNLKSHSDVNLHLAASKDKVPAGKVKTPKREVTSKIANLWKKVEETKQKNKNLKDGRLWIGPEKKEDIPDEILIIEQEEIVEIPRRKVTHSHTSQSLTDEIAVGEQKLFRGKSNFEVRTGIERRNIVSAVVQPYNYSPPASAQVTSTNLKHVNLFHKGSLKVTTV